MERCSLYCVTEYVEENQSLVLVTSILMVLAVCKSLLRKKKAKTVVRTLGVTTLGKDTFFFAGDTKGQEGLDIPNGKDTLISTPTKKAVVPLGGSSESLRFTTCPSVGILPESTLPPVDPDEAHGAAEKRIHIGHVEASAAESLNKKEHEGLPGLKVQSEKASTILTPTKAARPSLQSSQSLGFSPQVWTLHESPLPCVDYLDHLENHKMNKKTHQGHKLNLPIVTEDPVGALRPEYCYRQPPTTRTFKRSFKPSNKEQSLTLSPSLPEGPTNVLPLRPPVCVVGADKMIFQMEDKKLQQVLPHIAPMNRVQKVTQDGLTKTEPHKPWHEARFTEPSTIPKVPKPKSTLEAHRRFDDLWSDSEVNSKSSQRQRYSRTVATTNNRNVFEVQLRDFVKQLQTKICKTLKL